MSKLILISLASIGALFYLTFVVIKLIPKKSSTQNEKIHYHAGFVVFENNKKLDFSDTKYMFLKPCLVNGKEEEEEEDRSNLQLEKAHLHDNVGDVVHIEAKDPVWKDLFANIKFTMKYSNTTGYINNKKIENFQNQPIRPYDSLVVFIGENDEKLLEQKITREYIETQSKKSIECGN